MDINAPPPPPISKDTKKTKEEIDKERGDQIAKKSLKQDDRQDNWNDKKRWHLGCKKQI